MSEKKCMKNHSLQNITPIDGRYKQQLVELSKYFSEFSYIQYRVKIEIEYILFLSQNGIVKKLSEKDKKILRSIYQKFSLEDAIEIKGIESTTNHDVKAIEYYIQNKCHTLKLDFLASYIHWGITSDDTNNLAYSLALLECNSGQIVPVFNTLLRRLYELSAKNKGTLLLARTHGQPAVPTTFGKEFFNFYARLNKQLTILSSYCFDGKLMGAVGNLSAHKLAFPNINWIEKSKEFVRSLGLTPHIHTTQILPFDTLISYFQTLMNINNILRGLSRDIWTYIMLEEISLKKTEGEVGSSTMPQKVNPIDFENAEGNVEIANAYFQMYEQQLFESRLQRDLSDSIIKRTFGTAISHTLLAWHSIIKGLQKIDCNGEVSKRHIDDHYEVLAEAIQTQLRLKNDEEGYEKVKKMTRGKKMTKALFQTIVHELHLDSLKDLTPEKYLGYAEELVSETSL